MKRQKKRIAVRTRRPYLVIKTKAIHRHYIISNRYVNHLLQKKRSKIKSHFTYTLQVGTKPTKYLKHLLCVIIL